jgi:hypothetical protein
MDKRFAAVGVILIFVTLCFSGCEILEEKPDYITVRCTASILVSILDKNNNTLNEHPINLPIRVDFIKDGGERFTLQCKTGTFGVAEIETVSFKLYKDQPIEAEMTVQGGYMDYVPTSTFQSQTLTWKMVHVIGGEDFGGEYTWTPNFYVFLKNNTAR